MSLRPTIAACDTIARLASDLTIRSHFDARFQLKRMLLQTYFQWCRQQPDRQQVGGKIFRRDGMVLREIRKEDA